MLMGKEVVLSELVNTHLYLRLGVGLKKSANEVFD